MYFVLLFMYFHLYSFGKRQCIKRRDPKTNIITCQKSINTKNLHFKTSRFYTLWGTKFLLFCFLLFFYLELREIRKFSQF